MATGVGPAPADEGSMPAQDRLGRDEERRPALLGDEPRQGGDECSVRPGEAGSCDLAAKDRHLVAQHQDLGVLGDAVHVVDRQELEDPTDQAVEEAERHGRHDRCSNPARSSRDRVVGPFTSSMVAVIESSWFSCATRWSPARGVMRPSGVPRMIRGSFRGLVFFAIVLT